MKYPLMAAVAAMALLLAGCETAPKSPSTPASAITIKAADEFEASMLQAPVNAEALAQHALQLAQQANVANQPAEAQRLRQRAVEFAQTAQQHGAKNLLIPVLLTEINPDGSLIAKTHSSHAEADKLIHEGERHFSRGDMDAALDCYQRALKADPTSSRAALFAGDVYFAKREFADALPWFEKAITLEPNTETPYRYRADALMRLRRYEEAGKDYINAFVCAPFAPIPTQALTNWISQRRLQLDRPDSSFIVGGLQVHDGKLSVVIDPEKSQWIGLAYAVARANYATEKKLKPGTYRQSLEEELTALRTVITIAGEFAQSSPKDAVLVQNQAMLNLLRQIEHDGFLEAHILLDRLNEAIAKDYLSYLSQHREKLTAYIERYWLKSS